LQSILKNQLNEGDSFYVYTCIAENNSYVTKIEVGSPQGDLICVYLMRKHVCVYTY